MADTPDEFVDMFADTVTQPVKMPSSADMNQCVQQAAPSSSNIAGSRQVLLQSLQSLSPHY